MGQAAWSPFGPDADRYPSWPGLDPAIHVFASEAGRHGLLEHLADGEAVVVLVDDNKVRIAIQLEHQFDIDLMVQRVCQLDARSVQYVERGARLGGDPDCAGD